MLIIDDQPHLPGSFSCLASDAEVPARAREELEEARAIVEKEFNLLLRWMPFEESWFDHYRVLTEDVDRVVELLEENGLGPVTRVSKRNDIFNALIPQRLYQLFHQE